MGIDPGLTRLGFGVVEAAGSKLTALAAGVISTSSQSPVPKRLAHIQAELTGLLCEWKPNAIAVERVFLKSNSATAIPAIQASGVALMLAGAADLEVGEYSPAEVKVAVAGKGNAVKEQVRYMVSAILGPIHHAPGIDAFDALAVAVCHINSRRSRALEEMTG